MGRIIIGLGGRKESGKSALSKVCKEYGYEVVRFAEPLKQLVSSLIHVKREELDALKNVEREYVFYDMDCQFIAKETDIDFHFIKEKLGGKVFHTVRELLQIIGTDIIREKQSDWHVRKTLEYIESEEIKDKNVVIDDLRFPNERKMIESLGGTCWFIIRPRIDNISNHISETSLIWQDFENVIVNDESLEYLIMRWRLFIECDYLEAIEYRNKVIKEVYKSKENISVIVETDTSFTMLDMLFISKHLFTYNHLFFDISGEVTVQDEGNGSFAIDYNGYTTHCSNPFMIEDLKKYIN